MDQFIYIRSLGVTTSCESWPEEWGCGYWQQKWASSVCAQLSHSGGPHSRQRRSGSSSGWIRGRRFQLKGDRGHLQDNLKHLCLNCSPNNSDLDKWRKTREPNWSTPTQTRCKTTKKTQRSAKRQKLEAKYSKHKTATNRSKETQTAADRHEEIRSGYKQTRRAGKYMSSTPNDMTLCLYQSGGIVPQQECRGPFMSLEHSRWLFIVLEHREKNKP